MMPLRKFTIHQPKTIAEASQMLAEFGEKGRLYAGGTELLLAMKHDLLALRASGRCQNDSRLEQDRSEKRRR